MKKQVTPEAVWDALRRDPLFNSKHMLEQMAYKPFTDKLPELLKDMLSKKVTLKTLSEARYIYGQYCLKNGFVDQMINELVKIFEEMPFFVFDAKDVKKMLKQGMKVSEEIVKKLISDAPAYLKELGLNEKQFMLNQIGFNVTTLKAYKAGTLTIGVLLLEQPNIIVGLQPAQ